MCSAASANEAKQDTLQAQYPENPSEPYDETTKRGVDDALVMRSVVIGQIGGKDEKNRHR